MKLSSKTRIVQWGGGLILMAAFLYPFLKRPPIDKPRLVPAKDPQCESAYRSFYLKDEIEIRIIFGYKDSRPARFVGDRYERAHFIRRLADLNFTRDRLDDDLFTTQIMGPDQKLKTVKLRVAQSSVGPDDVANRQDPYQRYRSSEAERVFLEGLSHADAVFYNGHSRDGGGPDFEPPLCVESTQHVAYAWYRSHRPGLKKMINALNAAPVKPNLIGLFSCSSSGHFAGSVLRASPSGLIATSSLLYYSDALQGLVETLDGLLKQKCQADFHPLGTQLLGFFPKKLKI
ncbi:MAG: hypothetical protein H7333_02665 [Bdellovibrionales bacterium]|nr:hypothetical protein [Oligoflexia bacterium]